MVHYEVVKKFNDKNLLSNPSTIFYLRYLIN